MENKIEATTEKTHSSLKSPVFIIILVAAATLLTWWFYADTGLPAEEVRLTQEEALSLLAEALPSACIADGVEYSYQSCEVLIKEEGEAWRVAVTYGGLFDDSVRASRYESLISREGGQWIATPVSASFICQEGRGQQEFAPELCL
jgi:hypothetical protein